ncbi:hypothetical protein L915_07411 [Phytophthora nicotianae]|uniref:Uncharacterized protein n=1 Tax=Phytophthora nicotianae TaxID=4792 RepID=W2GZB8_PHYNI|nr:hypothetical protein L915_07411 [Phytophthora nicotianae]ETL41723.1 hypothetical protein L916_07355 [Phytophthora nicotianae]
MSNATSFLSAGGSFLISNTGPCHAFLSPSTLHRKLTSRRKLIRGPLWLCCDTKVQNL